MRIQVWIIPRNQRVLMSNGGLRDVRVLDRRSKKKVLLEGELRDHEEICRRCREEGAGDDDTLVMTSMMLVTLGRPFTPIVTVLCAGEAGGVISDEMQKKIEVARERGA